MKTYKLLYIGFLGIAFTTIGCLKDKGYEDQKYGIQVKDYPAVSFPQSTSSPISLSLNSSTSSQTISTDLSLEAVDAAASDIAVTIITDTVPVKAAGFTPLPASSFTLPLSYTIAKGKKLSTVTITFPNTTVLNPNIKYGIAIRITSVSQGYAVASNLKQVVFGFSIKNKYDGHYRVTGTFTDASFPAFTSVLPNECDLVTSGPNTVTLYRTINGAPLPGYLFSNAGAGTYYGNFAPVFTFDAAGKLITVDNFYGQGTNASSRFAFIDPTGTNIYDAATKSFTAKYTMNQPNTSTIRARFNEVYTYLRAR